MTYRGNAMSRTRRAQILSRPPRPPAAGHILRASWPIRHPEYPDAVLLTEARADLDTVAYRADAVVTGSPRFWIDWSANRVRAEAPARPRRVRRRDLAEVA